MCIEEFFSCWILISFTYLIIFFLMAVCASIFFLPSFPSCFNVLYSFCPEKGKY